MRIAPKLTPTPALTITIILISINVVKIETNHIVTKHVNITINARVAPTRKNKPILSEKRILFFLLFAAIIIIKKVWRY
jgi:hypothetical protein